MILGGDFDSARGEILDRLVGAVMAEGELVGATAQGQAHELMTKTDAKYRVLADKLSQIFDDTCQRLRITRAVGKPHTIRLEFCNPFGRGAAGHDGHATAERGQVTQAVVLETEVIGDHMKTRRGVGCARKTRMKATGRSISR